MKVELESEGIRYRGVSMTSETPEEKRVLESLWLGHGRVVMFARKPPGDNIEVTVAPTPELEVDKDAKI